MIAARTTLMDGDLVDTNNNGVVELNDSLPWRGLSLPKFIPPIADPFFPPPSVDPLTDPSGPPDRRNGWQFINGRWVFTNPMTAPPTEGTHGSGPAVVEQAARSIASPAATVSDGKPQPLPPVTVTGTADGKASIPWVPILIVVAVTVAIIVAVKVFGKRG